MLQDILKRKQTSIVLVGHSGSGKTTLASLLGSYSGIPVIEVGHRVIKEAAENGVGPLEFADSKIRAGKQLHFVENIISNQQTENPIMVVGPRLPEEVRFLKAMLGPTLIIGLSAPDKIREIRRCDPSELRKDKPSWLRQRDVVERCWGVDNALQMAHIILDATKSPSELLIQAESIWEEHGVPLKRRSISYFFYQCVDSLSNRYQSAKVNKSLLLQSD
jgi:Adenylate kinase and related kinases